MHISLVFVRLHKVNSFQQYGRPNNKTPSKYLAEYVDYNDNKQKQSDAATTVGTAPIKPDGGEEKIRAEAKQIPSDDDVAEKPSGDDVLSLPPVNSANGSGEPEKKRKHEGETPEERAERKRKKEEKKAAKAAKKAAKAVDA